MTQNYRGRHRGASADETPEAAHLPSTATSAVTDPGPGPGPGLGPSPDPETDYPPAEDPTTATAARRGLGPNGLTLAHGVTFAEDLARPASPSPQWGMAYLPHSQ